MSGSKTIRTMCPMNCHPTLCGMLAEVQDDRLVSLKGDKENPDSRGFLCQRGRAAAEIIANPKRILQPLMRNTRSADAWYEASWEETLDFITARMQAAGPKAVGIWGGHGDGATSYGTRFGGQLMRRFAYLYGSQWWNPNMICWGLGAFGLGLVGPVETSTKEDMAVNSELIILWGANLVSQPNTSRHLLAARRRGATIITIDIRATEAGAKSHQSLIIRPGTDAALALAMSHEIIKNHWQDDGFIKQHSLGFAELTQHIQQFTATWAAAITGLSEQQIVELAKLYAMTKPAMIVLGGSSMHKDKNGWTGARAIACLPALTGNLGIPGGGFGPRHGSSAHGQMLGNIVPDVDRGSRDFIPNQMAAMTDALVQQKVRVMLLFGTNMLSSFADSRRLEKGLAASDLVVCHDLFMQDTARKVADVILPGTAWLEQLGCKMTNTHLYLMEQALPAAGQARSLSQILRALAERLAIKDFFPWQSDEQMMDAVLSHPCTDHATVADLRVEGGIRAARISHVAHPDHQYLTPSGKIEFYSERAERLGLDALPDYQAPEQIEGYLSLRPGRTLNHFHGFYDHGRALPTLHKLEAGPSLWIAAADASSRSITEGDQVRVYNQRGEFQASAHIDSVMQAGTLWMRSGWEELNRLTSGASCIPDKAVDLFHFSAGQAAFTAQVAIERVN